MQRAQNNLTAADARTLALDVLRADLETELESDMAAQRQALIAAHESWWENYSSTLKHLEVKRSTIDQRLKKFLKDLGYDT